MVNVSSFFWEVCEASGSRTMITLSRKLREEKRKEHDKTTRLRSVRDILLTKEVPEMMENLPDTCNVVFPDPDVLKDFYLRVKPDQGFWRGGSFNFHITVPEEHNIKPPLACCETKIWHPNINKEGQICLSMLREHTLDGSGWAPTRKLKDLVWGIDSLFTDLLDFEDALNTEAAEQHRKDESLFRQTVKGYIENFAPENETI